MKKRAGAMLLAFVRGLGVNFGFLVFMVLFVAGIGLATGYSIYRLREKAIDAHFKITAMHARSVEDHLTQSFNVVGQTLANIGDGLPSLPQADVPRRLEGALLTSPALRSISLLDGHGRIVASSNPKNLGVQVDSGDYLPRHGERSDRLRIGRPWAGRDFGDGSPGGAAPARMDLEFVPALRNVRFGALTSTLAAAVNSDYFVNNYSARIHPEEGFVEVLRYDGTSLLSTQEPLAGGESRGDLAARISETESGSFEEELDGTQVLTSFRASRSYPLVVVAHLKLDYALAEWAAESRRLLLVTGPALLALVVLTSLLFVHLRRIEEQQVEARQREQDRLAATVFRTVDSGVQVADATDRIIAVNPAFTHITGYTEADVIGRKWQVFAARENRPECFADMTRALAATGSWHGELWHRHRDGERYLAWQSVNQVRREDGEVMYKVIAFSDITDRKKAEEAQLKAVIEASPEAVLLVESDGRIGYANRVCERMFGYTPEEALGLDVNELVPLPHRGRHRQYVAAFAQDPHSRPLRSGIQLTAVRKEGSEFPVEISLSPITMGDRLVIIAAINDITQRIRDEQALRASEERWKFALEGAGEGVWDLDVATGAVLFSKRILQVWGCAAGDGPQRLEAWTGRIHEEDRARVSAQLQACLDGRTRTCTIEHRARCDDGRWHWALVHGMVVSRDADGNPLRMIGTYADISERKAVEHELKAAKDAAEALLERASMAERRILDISEQTRERIGQELHDDLGQHLTGAAFLSEILFRKLDAVKRAERDDAAAITRLINDAVAKTRTLAQGLYPVELREAGLRSMIGQLADNVERTFEVKCEVRADRDFAADDPGVAINLFRVVQEAISNAVRHGKATRVIIAMRRESSAMVLEVEDNGCGLQNGEAPPGKGGLGMHTMRYRAGLIGAQLHIGNGESGGVKVVIALPLSEEIDDDAIQRTS
ncbi:MAG: PAS domain S-box protein [Ignavibacteria bacterium]